MCLESVVRSFERERVRQGFAWGDSSIHIPFLDRSIVYPNLSMFLGFIRTSLSLYRLNGVLHGRKYSVISGLRNNIHCCASSSVTIWQNHQLRYLIEHRGLPTQQERTMTSPPSKGLIADQIAENLKKDLHPVEHMEIINESHMHNVYVPPGKFLLCCGFNMSLTLSLPSSTLVS